MGWKSTIDISRSEAKRLIMIRLMILDHMTNEELANLVEELGYGSDDELEYYGYNFIVIND